MLSNFVAISRFTRSLDSVEWIRRLLEDRALRYADMGTLELPADLRYLEKTVLLWPENPDDAAVEIAQKMTGLLDRKLALAIGFADNCPLEIEYRRLDMKGDVGLFDYPKSLAVDEIRGYTASIDLSPQFRLRLAGLPTIAGIPLRIGRDKNKMGSFYNVMLTGKNGKEIETLIGAMKK